MMAAKKGAAAHEVLTCFTGIVYLSCPVFGRPDAVAARKAVMVMAGEAEAKMRVRPLLEPLGRAVLGESTY